MLVRNNFKKAGKFLLTSFAGIVVGVLIVATLLFYSSQIFAAEKVDGTYTTKCIKNEDNHDVLVTIFYGKHIKGSNKGIAHFNEKALVITAFSYADQWCLKPFAKMVFSYDITSTKGGIIKGKQTSITYQLNDRHFLDYFKRNEIFEKKDWKLFEKVAVAGTFPNVLVIPFLPKNGTKVDKKFSIKNGILQFDKGTEFLRKTSSL